MRRERSNGWVKIWMGEREVAIANLARALRLSPQDPDVFSMQGATALAHFFAGRYAEALSWAELALGYRNTLRIAACTAAAGAAIAGREAQARKAMARLREIDTALRLSTLGEVFPIRRAEDLARWTRGLRLAGLPE